MKNQRAGYLERPRVVHVYKDVYPPIEGGIERTIFNVAQLTKEWFEPVVITASRSGRGCERFIDDDVRVIEIPSAGRLFSTPLAPGFRKAMEEVDADLFHFHLPHPPGEISYLLSKTKVPAVATYHSDIVKQKKILKFYRPFLHRFLRSMEVIMPTSQRYLETSRILSSHRDRCKIVPLGLPLDDYEADNEILEQANEYREGWGNFVFFIGVLRYYKGLHNLILAMKELPDTHLVIAGDGPEAIKLNALAMKHDLENRIHFLGAVDHTTAVALFHAASIFCLPANQRSEAYGLCQIEAMACGLPVISTNLPTGVPDVNRHDESGFIVEPNNVPDLVDAITRLLEDEDLRKTLGENARKRALKLYGAEKMAESIIEIYNEVLEAQHEESNFDSSSYDSLPEEDNEDED